MEDIGINVCMVLLQAKPACQEVMMQISSHFFFFKPAKSSEQSRVGYGGSEEGQVKLALESHTNKDNWEGWVSFH